MLPGGAKDGVSFTNSTHDIESPWCQQLEQSEAGINGNHHGVYLIIIIIIMIIDFIIIYHGRCKLTHKRLQMWFINCIARLSSLTALFKISIFPRSISEGAGRAGRKRQRVRSDAGVGGGAERALAHS